jgi:hypothetical protein
LLLLPPLVDVDVDLPFSGLLLFAAVVEIDEVDDVVVGSARSPAPVSALRGLGLLLFSFLSPLFLFFSCQI